MYSPNLNDPRVLKRIKHAYGYARGVFSEINEQQKSRQAIEKRFGQLNNPVSQYLFQTLLICTDEHYSEAAGISKKYKLNPEGVKKIQEILKGNLDIVFEPGEIKLLKPNPSVRCIDELAVNSFIEREYGEQLKTLEFEYEDKSSRYWNEIQNIRSEFRHKALAKYGLKYNYDIRACAPTLLMQHAQQQNGLCFPEIEKFLEDRNSYRQFIADECEIGIKEAKTIINSLFCGAMLGLNNQFALTKILNFDVARILCAKEITTTLRSDIKEMWNEIKPTMSRRRSLETNRLIPLQSKDKWARYFRLEREVIDAVRVYLKKTDNKHFLEHDGWTCEKQINEQELIVFVFKKTGYKIQLDMNMNEFSNMNGVSKTPPTSASTTTLSLRSLIADVFVKNQESKEHIYKFPPPVIPHVPYKSSETINDECTDAKTWLQQYYRRKK